MQLYSYFRSSASYRVRIALALKGLSFDYIPVHLQKKEQARPPFSDLSASQLVPLLKDGDASISQGMALDAFLSTQPSACADAN